MPTYEYECKTCGARFDVFQSIKARPLQKTDCDNCGTVRAVRRLIGTGGAVIFKGSGFYQTDYRSDGYRKAAKADSEPTSTSSAAKGTSAASSGKGDSSVGKTEGGSSKAKNGDKKTSPDQKSSKTQKTGSSANGGK